MPVKKKGKFSSTLILVPPNEKPQAFSVFLKNDCIKMMTEIAVPMSKRGAAWLTLILLIVWPVSMID